MIHLELLNERLDKRWDDVVAGFDEGTIFHSRAWMQVIERCKGAKALPVGIFDGADLVGVFPMFQSRRGLLTVLASPLGSVGYGGPLIHTSMHDAVFRAFERLQTQLKADYVDIRAFVLPRQSVMAEHEYVVDELKTIVLELERTPEELWANLKGECRTAVRKARKNNVEIIEATDTSFLDIYYPMLEDTYSKSNRPPPRSKRDYRIVWDVLHPRNQIKVLLAKHDGRIIAGAMFLRFCDKVYYWDGAAFRKYYKYNANNLLHWTLIEWGATSGLTRYDMLGANIPSIARFKKSFGGDVRPYAHAYKETTLRAQVGRRLYQSLAPHIKRVQFKLWPA